MRPAEGVVVVLEGLEAWVRSRLLVLDITAVRTRPWADVWRVTTSDGVWWLKVNSRATGYETRLLDLFRRRQQPMIPDSISHAEQPWALIKDAGLSVRQRLDAAEPAEVVAFWADLLPRYAELQQSITARDVIGVGVPDLSPSMLVDHDDHILAESTWFRLTIAPDYSSAVHQRVLSARSALLAITTELAQGLPATIQHDDLHDGNVFTSRAGPMIIDWGDAVLAHPFSTLRVTLDVLSAQLDIAVDNPVLRSVADAYLEPWLQGGESRAELRRQLDLALRVAGLGRALGWARALGSPEAGQPFGFGDEVASWVGQFADDVLGPSDSDH